LVCRFVSGVPSGRTNNYLESGRGLGHVSLTIFGSTVGYPSDSLASCYFFTARCYAERGIAAGIRPSVSLSVSDVEVSGSHRADIVLIFKNSRKDKNTRVPITDTSVGHVSKVIEHNLQQHPVSRSILITFYTHSSMVFDQNATVKPSWLSLIMTLSQTWQQVSKPMPHGPWPKHLTRLDIVG